MELVLYPHPVLRKRAQPVDSVDEGLRARVHEMFEVLYREKGVGLAAPQVNWSARVFIVNVKGEPDPEHERVYINPQIRLAEGEISEEEGCLSIPGVRGKVVRSERVIVSALDLEGRPFEEDVRDLHARAIQHEIDHLDGILFITRLGVTDRMSAGKVLKQLEKDYKNHLRSAAGPMEPSRRAPRGG
jgi:peptide deformylase